MSKKRIVFIGDSITEWGRFEDSENIGNNYVRLIHDHLLVTNPDHFPEIINRGIGGNRITDLANRWQEDVIDLQPNLLSISIGINDVWRQLDNDASIEQVLPDQFEKIYLELIQKTREHTEAKIILMEPTIIEEKIDSLGNDKLKAYVNVIHKIANLFDLPVVPTHQAFLEYLQSNATYPLTTDGVHMNNAGNYLMAQTWLKTIGLL